VPNLTADIAQEQGTGRFTIAFTLDGTSIGTRIDVGFLPTEGSDSVCDDFHRSFLPFKRDCNPPHVVPAFSARSYNLGLVESLWKGEFASLVFDLTQWKDPVHHGNCTTFFLQWHAWRRSKINPINPISLSGKADFSGAKVVKGTAAIKGGEGGDAIGQFAIRVCCISVEKKCVPRCELVRPI